MEFPAVLISGSYNIFDSGWNECGVYACSGLYHSDTFKYPLYIGSTKDLKRRIKDGHISPLNRGVHSHNEPLQYSWFKYGQENFVWLLLESCKRDDRKNKEDFWLQKYRPFVDELGGFNIQKTALGCYDRSLESIAKSVEFHSKYYKFLSPYGEIFEGKNISEFCRQQNLVVCQMIDVLNGKNFSHKGWTAINNPRKINKYIGVDFSKSNGGFRVRILCGSKRLQRNFKNEKEAAEAYDQVCLYIYGVESGPINFPEKRSEYLKTYKEFGKWFCEGKRRRALDRSSVGKGFKLKSPDGKIYEGINTEEFSKKMGLDPSGIRKVMNGKLRHYKKWTKAD